MIRRPPRSTPLYSSAASDVYKRQPLDPRPRWLVLAVFSNDRILSVTNDSTVGNADERQRSLRPCHTNRCTPSDPKRSRYTPCLPGGSGQGLDKYNDASGRWERRPRTEPSSPNRRRTSCEHQFPGQATSRNERHRARSCGVATSAPSRRWGTGAHHRTVGRVQLLVRGRG